MSPRALGTVRLGPWQPRYSTQGVLIVEILRGSLCMNTMTASLAAARGWGPLILLPVAVLIGTPPALPRWLLMWLLAFAIFAGCKWLTWRHISMVEIPWQL